MSKCREKGPIKDVSPFRYRNKVVIGIYGLSTCQLLKTSLPAWLWTLTLLYAIARAFVVGVDEVYLIGGEGIVVLMVTVFVILWTFFVRKDTIRANHVYKATDDTNNNIK